MQGLKQSGLRTGLRGGGIALAALVLAMAFWDRFFDSMIFQPTPGADRDLELSFAAEDVFLDTRDGVRIHAYFLDAPGASRAVLFLHGNAGNASHRLPNAAELARLRAQVLLLEYRGYGRSQGRPSEAGVYADARAGLAHLVEARGVPEARVVAFGRSLGGAVAVDLAREHRLAGVVLESTFPSVAAMARSLLGIPVGALVGSRFASDAKIRDLRSPLLFFHGDRDRIVDIELGRQLFELAPEPKAFEVVRGAGHNDVPMVGGRAYFQRLGRFLDEVAPLGG